MKTFTAIYDLEVSPITFDITKFLLLAEQYRVEHNYSDLNVVIVGPSKSRLANLIERYSNFSDEMIGLEFFESRIEKLFEPLITLSNENANWQYVGDRDSLENHFVLGHVFPANYSISDPVAAYGIDCLMAGVVYRREFYQDVDDLEPKNSLMFTITFIPFATVKTPFIKQ